MGEVVIAWFRGLPSIHYGLFGQEIVRSNNDKIPCEPWKAQLEESTVRPRICLSAILLIQFTLPKVCGHLLFEHLIPKSWRLIWSWSSRMALYAIALRFPFTGTKRPSPNHETAPDHYYSFTKHYSWHYALGQVAYLSVRLPDGEEWSITLENLISTAPESNSSKLYTTPADACIDAAQPWKPMETHLMKLPMSSSCAYVSSRCSLELFSEFCNSVVGVASMDRQFFTCFSTWWPHSVSLCGLPLRGWAVVAPRPFHFTITALTVDQGNSSGAEIWLTC